jgi:hypothetical protein
MRDAPQIPTEVRDFVAAVEHPVRRRDAETMLELMVRATGETAVLRGTIVEFGRYHYEYASGRSGDAAAAGFAPRKARTVVYLMDGLDAHTADLERLGPHERSVGCLYLKDLQQVDLAVLEQIVADCYATLTSETFGLRAREGGS